MDRKAAAVVAMATGVVSAVVGAFILAGAGVALLVLGAALVCLAVLLGWS